METLKTDMTWEQIVQEFEGNNDFSISVSSHNRRSKLSKRKNGLQEDRQVVRLKLQQIGSNSTKTVFSKNLKNLSEEYMGKSAGEAIITKINNAMATCS